MKRIHVLIAALLLGLTLTLSACGGDAGSDGKVASAVGEDVEGADDPVPADPEELAAKYEKCMLDSGADLPDPEPGGDMRLDLTKDEEAKLSAALETCRQYLPQASGERAAEQTDGALEFAKCMRKNGVEAFKDPSSSGMIAIDPAVNDDPDYEKALDACGELMGIPAGGAGGPS